VVKWIYPLALASLAAVAPGQSFPRPLRAIVYVPKSAKVKPTPLIVYLHGKSLRGEDLRRVRRYGLPKLLLKRKDFPFIVVAPQCPSGQRWTDPKAIMRVVERLRRRVMIDKNRTYAMGFSMGGRGVMRLAAAYPQHFAAVVTMGSSPIESLWTDSTEARKIPLWTFHGDADDQVPHDEVAQAVKRHQRARGRAHLTTLPGRDHSITDVFERQDIYKWLLKQQRRTSLLDEARGSSRVR